MKIIFLLLVISLIPLITLANAQTPLSIDAQTANIFYDYGESVGVSGKIQNYDPDLHSHLNVEYSVLNPSGDVITLGQTDQISTGSFSFNFIARGTSFESSGDYSIRLVFGTTETEIPMFLKGGSEIPPDVTAPIILQLQDIVVYAETVDGLTEVTYNVQVTDDTDEPIKPICKPTSGFSFSIGDTIVQCTARDSVGNFAIPMLFTVTVNPPEVTQIDPPSLELDAGPEDTSEQKIPDWVKNTMKWFIEGAITEDEIISAIQYLVNAGIIKLS
ncbi:MAG: hypothetical protein ACE5DL_06330 [Nitrosopumilaceae archaeon]